MSIETLKTEFAALEKAAQQPMTKVEDVQAFLKDWLVPWLENHVAETDEIDTVVGELVTQEDDVIHEANGAVFAAALASAKVLVGELKTRIGNDNRLLAAIKEFEGLARDAERLLEELVVADPEADDDEDDDEGEGDAKTAAKETP